MVYKLWIVYWLKKKARSCCPVPGSLNSRVLRSKGDWKASNHQKKQIEVVDVNDWPSWCLFHATHSWVKLNRAAANECKKKVPFFRVRRALCELLGVANVATSFGADWLAKKHLKYIEMWPFRYAYLQIVLFLWFYVPWRVLKECITTHSNHFAGNCW